MRPQIVYVHGCGNQVRPDLLKRRWDDALFGRDQGGDSRMAYWAPLLHDEPEPEPEAEAEAGPRTSESTPPGVPEPPEPPELFVARTIERALERARAGAVLPGPTAPAPLAGTARDTPAADTGGQAAWLRAMTYAGDALANGEDAEPAPVPPFGALPLPLSARQAVFRLLVRYTFEDVHAYLFGKAGEAIRDVLREELEGVGAAGPVVVIGHSLGSVIAYEVLREDGTEVRLLITIGSPLAVTEIQDHLAKPLAVPAGVGAWRNVSDARDVVALDHTIRPEYAPAERTTDFLVTNDSANHHAGRQYLASPPVRQAVDELLENGDRPWR